MTESYYAMIEDKSVTDDERKIVLATLYRPSSTGVVKDDAAPTGIAALFSRGPN